jgi:hypothetical protein
MTRAERAAEASRRNGRKGGRPKGRTETPERERPELLAISERQRQFLFNLLKDPERNQGRAYQAAGYAASKVSAQELASRLMRTARVAKAWRTLEVRSVRKAARNTELSAARVIEEMGHLALFDVADLFGPDGNLLPVREMPESTRRAIAGIEVVIKNLEAGDGHVDTIHKVKLVPKVQAIELAAKHFKLLTDVIRVDMAETVAAKLAAGRLRAAARNKPKE